MLSGMAVELTQGDPFLRGLTGVVEGPLRLYKDGREKGLFRKVGSRTFLVLGGVCIGASILLLRWQRAAALQHWAILPRWCCRTHARKTQ